MVFLVIPSENEAGKQPTFLEFLLGPEVACLHYTKRCIASIDQKFNERLRISKGTFCLGL